MQRKSLINRSLVPTKSQPYGGILAVFVGLIILMNTCPALADPLANVRPQLQLAQAALQNKDFETSEKQLNFAYLKNPHPQLLCWFGRWAARQAATAPQRGLALDYFRRCLAASSPPEDAELVAEARAALAAPVGADEYVELQVLASGDEFLWVDDHLAGRFPLARPLLLRPGRHVLRRARGSEAPLQREVTLSPDQPIYVTAMQGAWDVGFMDLFLVLLSTGQASGGVDAAALWRLIEATLERDTAIAVSHRRAGRPLTADQLLPGCDGDLACLAELGAKSRVPYVLDVGLRRGPAVAGRPGVVQITVTTYDVRAEEISGTLRDESPDGDRPGLERRLTELLRRARKTAARPLGILPLRSTPEAQLSVDGRDRGRTPRSLALTLGPHTLVLRRADFHDLTQQIVISEGPLPPIDLGLAPLPLTRGEKFLRVGGWVLGGAGLAGLTIALTLRLFDGQLKVGSNPLEVVSTTGPALGFLISGGVALTGGIIIIAIDRSRTHRRKAPWQ